MECGGVTLADILQVLAGLAATLLLLANASACIYGIKRWRAWRKTHTLRIVSAPRPHASVEDAWAAEFSGSKSRTKLVIAVGASICAVLLIAMVFGIVAIYQ